MFTIRFSRWYISGAQVAVIERLAMMPFPPTAGLTVRLHHDETGRELGVVCIDRVTWDIPANRFEAEEDCRIIVADDMHDEVDACVAAGWRRVDVIRALGQG